LILAFGFDLNPRSLVLRSGSNGEGSLAFSQN
jgi:hypothetical protein